MPVSHTFIPTFLLSVSLFSFTGKDKTPPKEKNQSSTAASNKALLRSYVFHLDNTINKNDAVDSVLVVLDKFNLSGAGTIRKVLYPDSNNQFILTDLPAGKYYADIYVLGNYRKSFSTIIHAYRIPKKNKLTLRLDYRDFYIAGKANIPPEDTRQFSFNR